MAERAERYVKSPLNYIGGKFRLLPQILPRFPEGIATFVDLFCGGCNVSVNVAAERVVCNDVNFRVVEMLRTFQLLGAEEILARIEKNIADFGLSETNEAGFQAFREHYNRTKDALDLYTLACFSFNYQIRFNNRLIYNNPFGRNRSRFSARMRDHLSAFVARLRALEISFCSADFRDFPTAELRPDDFVYCDPPYLIATGSYNDGRRGFGGWEERDDLDLYGFLDGLHAGGIRFALSNVLEHKGRVNEPLAAWSASYRVHELDADYSNAAHNTARRGSREVLITNY